MLDKLDTSIQGSLTENQNAKESVKGNPQKLPQKIEMVREAVENRQYNYEEVQANSAGMQVQESQ